MISMPDRKALGDDRALDPEVAASSDCELERDLPAPEALREELVGTELLEGDDLQFGRVLSNSRDLERVEDHDPPVALLCIEEGIRDRYRHFVAQLRCANRIAVDQHVGHGADPNGQVPGTVPGSRPDQPCQRRQRATA